MGFFKFNITYILFLFNAKYELFCLVITYLRETCSMIFQNKHAHLYPNQNNDIYP